MNECVCVCVCVCVYVCMCTYARVRACVSVCPRALKFALTIPIHTYNFYYSISLRDYYSVDLQYILSV
jgi:hypothetical protein